MDYYRLYFLFYFILFILIFNRACGAPRRAGLSSSGPHRHVATRRCYHSLLVLSRFYPLFAVIVSIYCHGGTIEGAIYVSLFIPHVTTVRFFHGGTIQGAIWIILFLEGGTIHGAISMSSHLPVPGPILFFIHGGTVHFAV